MDARGEDGVTLLEAYRALFPQWRKPREPEHPALCIESWADCPNAVHTLNKSYPVMRCKLTGRHPDYCRADPAHSPDDAEQVLKRQAKSGR